MDRISSISFRNNFKEIVIADSDKGSHASWVIITQCKACANNNVPSGGERFIIKLAFMRNYIMKLREPLSQPWKICQFFFQIENWSDN